MIDIGGIAMRPEADASREAEQLKREVARLLRIDVKDVRAVKVVRRSVDARKKGNIKFVYRVAATVEGDEATVIAKAKDPRIHAWVPAPSPAPLVYQHGSDAPRPIVVGEGPAGLFCALELARAGARPLLVERGHEVGRRSASIAVFDESGVLDPNTNVQFGEGGAGAFSDGKLATGVKGTLVTQVIRMFVDAGAPSEIAWDAKPHIGSDKLPAVVRHLREAIVEAGGEVRHDTMLTDIGIKDGHIASATLEDLETGVAEAMPCAALVLACGHSARDTFQMLYARGVAMQAKPFSMGVRIEHAQKAIDRAQYGRQAGNPALPVADYKLSCHVEEPWEESPRGVSVTRGVYSFCMCPGGLVLASASEEGGVVTNGASSHARDGANANAGLLVDVSPDDIAGEDPLRGIAFQRQVEQAAYALGGGGYIAPAQLLGDFMQNRPSSGPGGILPSYPLGVAWCSLDECLPPFVAAGIRRAVPALARHLAGFDASDAVLTGVETRSSSPVRIVRDESLQCNIKGLFPCGEGAGYAGGITSAAADGLRVAAAVARAGINH